MSVGFIAPRVYLERKPPHGAACTHCGLCCIATLCPLGKHVFGTEIGPCPALRRDANDKSVCGLAARPGDFDFGKTVKHGEKAMRDAALLLVGSGTGCDARFNGEPANKEFYAELERMDARQIKEVAEARRLWGA